MEDEEEWYEDYDQELAYESREIAQMAAKLRAYSAAIYAAMYGTPTLPAAPPEEREEWEEMSLTPETWYKLGE